MGFELFDDRYLEVSWKNHERHMLLYRKHLGKLYHPSFQGRFALFAVYMGFVMHKIILV
jgi:hypothetical protein